MTGTIFNNHGNAQSPEDAEDIKVAPYPLPDGSTQLQFLLDGCFMAKMVVDANGDELVHSRFLGGEVKEKVKGTDLSKSSARDVIRIIKDALADLAQEPNHVNYRRSRTASREVIDYCMKHGIVPGP